MEFNDLNAAEKAVIRSLQRIASRWPKTLRLIAVGGGLTVARSDGDQPDQPVTYVSGIPLGGEWQRSEHADYWVYEFSVRVNHVNAGYLSQEIAIRALITTAVGDRRRFTFTEERWDEFRESARRSGLSLCDIQRIPVMPAEDVL